jgi:GTPase
MARSKGQKNYIISENDITNISKIQLKKSIEILVKIAQETELSLENLQLLKSLLDAYNKFQVELEKKEEWKKQRLQNSVKKFVSFRNELLL